MGVYIRGMEMPKDDMKNIMILSDGRVFQFSGYGNPKPLGTVVHIPPHGRLGDLDTLYESCALDTNIDVMASAKRINEYMQLKIDDAPTIIPAEKGE